eukprot:4079025-Amphidinium_carterae.1
MECLPTQGLCSFEQWGIGLLFAFLVPTHSGSSYFIDEGICHTDISRDDKFAATSNRRAKERKKARTSRQQTTDTF